MAAPPQDSAASRLILAGRPPFVTVTGTTAATANTAATLAHGLVDEKGRALVPSFVQVTKNQNTTSNVFELVAGRTSAVIDVRADGAVAIAYTATVFA